MAASTGTRKPGLPAFIPLEKIKRAEKALKIEMRKPTVKAGWTKRETVSRLAPMIRTLIGKGRTYADVASLLVKAGIPMPIDTLVTYVRRAPKASAQKSVASAPLKTSGKSAMKPNKSVASVKPMKKSASPKSARGRRPRRTTANSMKIQPIPADISKLGESKR